ncbi:gas vesicle protein GvpG [Candidatus Parcubacteria bacterium]|nr:gas vesicle protein GvpG [Patescibacteria group bacterium]MCG2688560.1 gas vesicle protein GvpG [Candidatus Parcubacteria bacterium]
MFIIDDFLVWLAKEVQKIAEQEVTDESSLKEELLEVHTLYELDQIGEQEYQKREDEILARLETLRKEKETQTKEINK